MKRVILQTREGFTIVEVVILIVIVAIFLASLLPFMVQNMVANEQSKTRRLAYEAAYKKIENIRIQTFSTIQNESFATPTVSRGSGQVTVSHDVNKNGQIEQAENDILLVTVDVSYVQRSVTKHLSLSTVVTKGGISN